MTEITTRNFGLLIAYVLPGVVGLGGVARYSETVRSWFGVPPESAPTVGGFLYVTLGSIAAGMVLSILRWLLLDSLHHRTGIPRPNWDFSRLQPNLAAFYAVVDNHYRYYQCYGNMLMAVLIVGVTQAVSDTRSPIPWSFLVVAAGLLYLASADALDKYYSRTRALLGVTHAPERRAAMTNGFTKEDPVERKAQQAKAQQNPAHRQSPAEKRSKQERPAPRK